MTGTTEGFENVLPTPSGDFRRLGRYQVHEELARGGMGVVYRARHASLHHDVAIKVLRRSAGGSDQQRKRFFREAGASSRLEHPGIVRVHAVAEQDDELYMVMDLVVGSSLQALIDQAGRLSTRRALAIMRQLVDALDYAHGAGILHRDLKPGNILIDEQGTPRLVDFGLAKLVSPEVSQALSKSGHCLGTPGYWAPEQARGELDAMGPPTDVFGVGATLYAMLTGHPPHGEPATLADSMATLDRLPEPPSSSNPDVAPELDALVLRCLAPKPAKRFATVAELRQALERLDAQPSPTPWPLIGSACILGVGLLTALVAISRAPAATPSPSVEATPTLAVTSPEPTAPTQTPDPTPRETTSVSTSPEETPAIVALERGLVLLDAGEPEAAVAAFSKALGVQSQLHRALLGRAKALLNMQDIEGAIADLTEAIRLEPDDAEGYLLRGQARGSQNDNLGVVEDETEAIRCDPALALAHAYRGIAYIKLGRLQEGLADSNEAIRLEPDLAVAYSVRSTALGFFNDHEGALRDNERILELDPDGFLGQNARVNIPLLRQILERKRALEGR